MTLTSLQAAVHQTHVETSTPGAAAQECAAYLKRTMPQEDHGGLPEGYLKHNVELALKARRSFSWAADVPWPIFRQYVLPYAM